MTKPVYILNGPNSNLTGFARRDANGEISPKRIGGQRDRNCAARAPREIDLASGLEDDLVDRIQQARQEASGIVINAGAYTQTPVATPDVFPASDLPRMEVLPPNIQKQDTFRDQSYVSKAANDMIYGFGTRSPIYAQGAMHALIHSPS